MLSSLTLQEMQRIRQWQLAHRLECPLEYQLWDAVLSLWLMGWVGWLPVLLLDWYAAWPLCLLGSCAPALYVRGRLWAHQHRRLRCDWLRGLP